MLWASFTTLLASIERNEAALKEAFEAFGHCVLVSETETQDCAESGYPGAN